MTAKGGSLTFPANPLAAMQELSALDAPSPPALEAQPPADTALRKPALTEARTDASKEAITDSRKDDRAEGRKEGRKPARPQGSTSVSEEVLVPNAVPDFLERVNVALASREPLIGGVKATVDMSPDLSSRAKRYLADNRGQNARQVIVAARCFSGREGILR